MVSVVERVARRAWVSVVAMGVIALAVAAAARQGGAGHAPTGARALYSPGGGVALTTPRLRFSEPTISSGLDIAVSEVNGDIRDLPPVPVSVQQRPELERPRSSTPPVEVRGGPPSRAFAPNMPAAIVNVDGLDFATWGAGYPPDTVGDVGLAHYVQAVNTSIGIYDKAGSQLAAMTFDTLWAGSGLDPCTSNQGDPTVVYDTLADRFIVADFAWSSLQNGPYYECVAVSKTSDPVTGGWWLYRIRTDDAAHPWLHDYPKMGIWPDGLYMTANMFDCLNAGCSSASYEGVRVYAFNRTELEAGTVPGSIVVDAANAYSLLPSNVRVELPPAGTPNYVVSLDPVGAFEYDVFKFHVDWTTPANSTFTGPTNVSHPAYTFNYDPVPTPGESVDSLADRLMMQAQYSKIGAAESVWLSRAVRSGDATSTWAVEWAQLDVTGGTVATSPTQLERFSPDALHRWMPSLAVDKDGNMAIGYSVADATTHPSIRYNGRLASDALNSLPQGETVLQAGAGSQSGGGGRWGDYSSMTLDPDGCTFWYTTEYYAATGSNWLTRIGSFRYPTCTTPTAVGLVRLTAARGRDGVSVAWRTASETAIAGFDVFRLDSRGRLRKLNRALVPAKRSGRAAGAAYRFADRSAARGRAYIYRLRVTDLAGARSWFGAAAVISG